MILGREKLAWHVAHIGNTKFRFGKSEGKRAVEDLDVGGK
jgi:hypothetical protein